MGPVVTDGSTVTVIFFISLRRHYPVRFVRSTAPSRPLSAPGVRSRVGSSWTSPTLAQRGAGVQGRRRQACGPGAPRGDEEQPAAPAVAAAPRGKSLASTPVVGAAATPLAMASGEPRPARSVAAAATNAA